MSESGGRRSKIKVAFDKSILPSESYSELVASRNRTGNVRHPVDNTVYINTLSFPVTIVKKSGKRFVVPPVTHPRYNGKFVIREVLLQDFQQQTLMTNYIRWRATEAKDENFGLFEVGKQLGELGTTKSQFNVRDTNKELYEDYIVCSETDFSSHDGIHCTAFYHTHTGVIISEDSIYNAPYNTFEMANPYMSEEDFLKECRGLSGHDILVRYEMVSPEGDIADKFVRLGNEVFRLKAKNDPTRVPGIYCTKVVADKAQPKIYQLKTIFSEIADAKEVFSLYTNKEDAINGGDVALANKKELVTLQHAHEQLKSERDKFRADLEMLKIEAEKEELQSKRNNLFEEKMLEHNAQMQKFLLTHTEITRKELGEWGKAKEEERSFVRKDVSEIIKLMSIAVVGIVGFINLFKK